MKDSSSVFSRVCVTGPILAPAGHAMLTNPAHHVFGMTPDDLRVFVAGLGMPAYRADQILEWVYAHGVADPAGMTNLSRPDRDTIARDLALCTGATIAHQAASDGVQKLLIQWTDDSLAPDSGAGVLPGRKDAVQQQEQPAQGTSPQAPVLNVLQAPDTDPTRQTECVMIPAEGRRTACVSSQVGCPVGCRFCASGLGGLDGNLSAGRIVEQVWRLARLPGVGRISNVVFMGMGEPLANFDNVKHAIETIAAPWGLNISARKITVSTVGLPKYIERLARELDLPVTLALSLHAPTDDIRRSLIPWSEFTTIAELLDACRLWFEKTGREITLEYTLMREINDRPEHARELARLARSMRSNVNLIRYNEVEGMPYQRPASQDVRAFQTILRDAGVTVHIRASRGRDIAAACGQLRHEAAEAGP